MPASVAPLWSGDDGRVLLAVVGYAVDTYGAWVSAQLMRIASGG